MSYDAIPPTQGAFLQYAKHMPLMQQVMHWAKQQLLGPTNRIQEIRVGVGKATTGKFAEVLCLQLQLTVRN